MQNDLWGGQKSISEYYMAVTYGKYTWHIWSTQLG